MRNLAAVLVVALVGGCAAEGLGMDGMGAGGGSGMEDGAGGRAVDDAAGGTGGESGPRTDDGAVLGPWCTEEEVAAAQRPLPRGGHVGFQGLAGLVKKDPVEVTVSGTGGETIELTLDSGERGHFAWPGPLPFDVPSGSQARAAFQYPWQILVTGAGSLAVLVSDGFGSPPSATSVGESLATISAVQCYFPATEASACDFRVPPGQLRAIVGGGKPIGSGSPVVVGAGRRADADGWTIENHVGTYLPGYSDGDCVLESWNTVLVTAYTTYRQLAPF